MRDANGIPEDDEDLRPLYKTVREYSFKQPWRTYRSEQFALAARAQEKVDKSRMYPVLPDISLLREWWLTGAMQGGVVHHKLVPMMEHALGLSPHVVWHILRLAGYICGEDGQIIGIANTSKQDSKTNTDQELEILRERMDLGSDFVFTSPGWHDHQLTPEEFFAWHRRQYCFNLDKMAEGRGRPRPGAAHPDAIPDDPDGVHGGILFNAWHGWHDLQILA